MHPKGPIRGVFQKEIFDQQVLAIRDVQEPRTILLPDQVADERHPPPALALTVHGTLATGSKGHIVEILHVPALQHNLAVSGPLLQVVRVDQGAIELNHNVGKAAGPNTPHEVKCLVGKEQGVARLQYLLQGRVQNHAILPFRGQGAIVGDAT